MGYKKELAEKLRDDLRFEQSLRTVLGYEIYPPSEREFELEDQIREIENPDEYGIPRY